MKPDLGQACVGTGGVKMFSVFIELASMILEKLTRSFTPVKYFN